MKSFRKLGAAILAGAMLLSMAACNEQPASGGTTATAADAGGGSGTGEQKVINLWHEWTTETDLNRAALFRAVDAYMAEHTDVKIEAHELENEAYKQKMSTEFAGNASGIDVFFYWGGGRGGTLAKAGKLLAIDQYLSDEIKNAIKPGAGDQFIHDGTRYALPTFNWMMILYCNTKLFDQAGAALPTTYDELKTAVEKLTAAGIEFPIAMGIKDGWQAAFVYEALAMRNVGVATLSKMFVGAEKFDNPGYLKAAEQVIELNSLNAFGKTPLEVADAEANALFYTGKAAMRLQGNWFTGGIYNDKETVVNEPGTVKAMPVPLTDGSNATDYSGGFVDTFYVNKNTAYPEIAVDFLSDLCVEIASSRQATGEGFSGFTYPVDDSNISEVAKQIKEIADASVAGAIAWDTALNAADAQVHLDSVQSLFSGGNPADVIAAHKSGIKFEN